MLINLGLISAISLEKRASISDKATLGYATTNGGTTGGGSVTPVTISTLSGLKTALSGNMPAVVIVSGTIVGNEVVKVSSNTTIVGKSGAALTGVGLSVFNASNVIIRNLKISKVLAETGDAIGIQSSNRVWVDHVDLSSDRDHDKDYYDGLLDITHGSYAISVTNSYLHDQWKASLVGHSDANEAEDTVITVTYAYNKWYNLNSRTPAVRFGHGHILNNYFLSNNDGVNCDIGSVLLIEKNVFESVSKPIYSTNGGTCIATGNSCDSCNTNPGIYLPTYSYGSTAVTSVKAYVNANAGAVLVF
ncbi:pectate lyase B [Ceratobasidium sp. AG-I]|nr:pectate lyase B [Ceratobasidium sp. AG-I]